MKERFFDIVATIVLQLFMSMLSIVFLYVAREDIQRGNELQGVFPILLSFVMSWIQAGSIKELINDSMEK